MGRHGGTGPAKGAKRTIKAVLFDKDGTLLDYQRTWTPINREVALLAAKGDRLLADRLLRLGGQDPGSGTVEPGSPLAAGTHEEIAALFAEHLGERTPERLADRIASTFTAGGARTSVLVQDALATLDALDAAGLVMGVATNDTAAGLEASLGRHVGLMERFRFLAGCDSGYGAKPEPGMVHAFAEITGFAPAEIAVVGDAIHDLLMGRKAGAGLCVGLIGGTSRAEHLAPLADHVLERLGDLVPLVTGR